MVAPLDSRKHALSNCCDAKEEQAMSDDETPHDSKLTTSKRRWAAEGKFLTGRISRPETERLPPGQHLVKNWPVLDLGQQPSVSTQTWKLDIRGLVEHPVTLGWSDFQALEQTSKLTDIHCVTTWSRYDNTWKGVSTRDLLDRVMPKEGAHYVMLTSYDGYTTNLPLEDFAAEDAILATSWEGEPLTRDHGGPMRLVVPHLYFWKSAKWLNRIELIGRDQAGFWERNGYHMLGDPWREQRYSDD
jgi:DMSO/TMAO reductase YedYZ molybdopterin-dependent catalytic subunit